jgi:hypothetical protein
MRVILLVLLTFFSSLKYDNGNDVIEKMYNKYAGKWMKSFSFSQTTEMYRNDSLLNTATWYENVVYPDKFRIDFGDKISGNAAIFTKDSVYSFRDKSLTKTSANNENLTFILGGMYFYSLDVIKTILAKMGYDLNKSFEAKFQNNKVYVIGANNANEKTNQLWIDKGKLIVVKFVSFSKGEKEEGIFYNHKQFGNSWSETACDFYIDGKLIQKEKYLNCRANGNIDLKIFNPYNFSLIE